MRSRFIRFANFLTLAVVCGLGLGTFLAARASGNPGSVLIGSALAAWDTLLLASIALFAHLVNARKLTHLCLLGTVVALIQLVAFVALGYTGYQQNENAIKEQGQVFVYLLEQHRAQHGSYPVALNLHAARASYGAPTAYAIRYYSTGDRYLLTLFPTNMLDQIWLYDSAAQRWNFVHSEALDGLWAAAP